MNEEFYFFTGSLILLITWAIMLSKSFEMAKKPIAAAWFRLMGVTGVIAYIAWAWANL